MKVPKEFAHVTPYATPQVSANISDEAIKVYMPRTYSTFMPYEILRFGFDRDNHPIDILTYAMWSSACYTLKKNSFKCNMWGSSAAAYIFGEGFDRKGEGIAWAICSAMRLHNAGHIHIRNTSTRETDVICHDGSSGVLIDRHMDITLKTRHCPRQRKVILPTQKTQSLPIETTEILPDELDW